MGNKPVKEKKGFGKSTLVHVQPEALTLVTDVNHILYDSRVELPPDENMVLNIMVNGLIEPVIVHKDGEKIEVVAGRCRTKAAIEANIRLRREGKAPILVPIIGRKGSDADLFGVMISENEVRNDDSAVNRGEKMRKMNEMGYPTVKIAATFGMTRQNVENMLAIDNLSEDVKNAINNGKIAATAALEVKNLSREDQSAVIAYFIASGEKPTVANVKQFVESGAYKNLDNSDDAGADRYVNTSLRHKAPPKKKLEKRLKLFEERGFTGDRYLQTKPADFQSGFEYALKWVLGHEQEDADFEIEAESESDSETD